MKILKKESETINYSPSICKFGVSTGILLMSLAITDLEKLLKIERDQ
jgi:hypothetical protein